jgi:hypothetical protein
MTLFFVALQNAGPIGHPILGIVLPTLIFAVSFWVAWICYRHFSRKGRK